MKTDIGQIFGVTSGYAMWFTAGGAIREPPNP